MCRQLYINTGMIVTSYTVPNTNQVLYAAIGCNCSLYLKFMFDIRIIISDCSNSQVILMPTSKMFLVIKL